MQIPTPIVIVSRKHGDVITETGRFRGDVSTFFDNLVKHMAVAVETDPDETVIRVLRPVYE